MLQVVLVTWGHFSEIEGRASAHIGHLYNFMYYKTNYNSELVFLRSWDSNTVRWVSVGRVEPSPKRCRQLQSRKVGIFSKIDCWVSLVQEILTAIL